MSHIEFLGVPGSGKSTLYNALSLPRLLRPSRKIILNNSRITSVPVLSVLFHKAFVAYWQLRSQEHYVANHISRRPQTAELIQYIAEGTERDTSSLIRNLFTTISEYEDAYESVSEGNRIYLDEGFVQRCLGVFYRGEASNFSIEKYLDCIPLPGVVVYVDAPTEVCHRRQVSRGLVKSNDPDNPLREINELKNQCSDIVDNLESQEVSIIHIDNNAPVPEVISELNNHLENVENYNEFCI